MPDHARIAVCFTLANRDLDWPDIERLDEADIGRAPLRFVGGRNSWIAQSYLRLRAPLSERGFEVGVSSRFRPGAICIAHRDDANNFLSAAHGAHLVVIRADRPPVRACDHAIVQNALAPTANEHFVPLWPQPGIVARDPRRAGRVERLGYAGRTGASPSWFFDDNFHRALRERGIAFDVRRGRWNDYRDVDVAIATRVAARAMLDVEPATKLYNAWLAGLPMLAGPEPAYCALRRSALDYIEVGGADDVLRALDRLRADPRLYRAMIDNGRARAREFSIDAVRARWLALIERVVVPSFVASNPRAGVSRRLWFIGAMAYQKLHAKVFRARSAWQLAKLTGAQPAGEAFTSASTPGCDVAAIRSRAA